MANDLRAMLESGNCISVSSLTNTPFIGGANGATLTKRLTTLSWGGNRTLDFEEVLDALLLLRWMVHWVYMAKVAHQAYFC